VHQKREKTKYDSGSSGHQRIQTMVAPMLSSKTV